MAHELEHPFDGETVTFRATYTSRAWERPVVSRSTLRFLGVATLDRLLAEAALSVVERFGDWDRSPLGPASPDVVTVARRGADGGTSNV